MGRGGEGVREKGEGVGKNGTAPYFSSSLAVLFSSRACFFGALLFMQANPLLASIFHFLTFLLKKKIWGSKC